MELKPGFKQTEVGVIPEDWDVQTMATLAKITTGPFGTLLKASEYSADDAGVPLVSVGEVRDGYIKITEHTPLVPPKVIRRLPQYVLRAGDIVFGRKGAVDRSALITRKEEGYFLGSDGISVRLSGPCNPIYISCQLRGHRVRSWLLQNAIGTTMASLNQGILKKIPLSLPPRSEQESIASALSDIDCLIENLNELISKKQSVKQATMQELLTGKRRLPDFEGEWEVRELGGLGTWRGGMTPSMQNPDYWNQGDFPWISSGDVKISRLSDTSQHVTAHAVSSGAAVVIPAKSIVLVTRSGILRKQLPVALLERPMAINQDIKALIPARDIDSSYLLHALKWAGSQILKSCMKTGTTVESVEFAWLKRFAIPVPSHEEQIAIAKAFLDMEDELAEIEAQRTKASALKQGMMQQLLTGKIRLK